MSLQVFNTLSGTKEEFKPQGDTVLMYVCGITPYADSHIGHAMSYIVFDMIRRYLEYRGYRLKYVQNFTDIDDKLIARAERLGVTYDELAEQHIAGFHRSMEALNVKRADVYPRATQEIGEIIALIQRLVDKGFAYTVPEDEGQSVYYRVSRFAGYGKLSKRSLEDMQAGARIEVNVQKEHPMDFALWKAAKPGEPSWDSPWGPGRPGWHIECSAMSVRYLGDQIDIHGGGRDLIFPHHENEIAQTEAGTGKGPFVRYWIHNGLLQLGDEKMSKSLGNVVPIETFLKEHSGDALRFFVLSSSYRGPLTLSDESIEAAERGVERLATALEGFDPEAATESATSLVEAAESARRAFELAMDDDFNSAQALAALFDLAREINRAKAAGEAATAGQAVLAELADVLGFRLSQPSAGAGDAAPFIDLLVSVRQSLRQAKQWQLADQVRDGLAELHVVVEDKPGGSIWKLRRSSSAPATPSTPKAADQTEVKPVDLKF